MTGTRLLAVLFVLAVALVTWDELARQSHVPPYPQRYVSLGLVFSILAVVDAFAPPLAAVFAAGVVLMLGYKAVGASASTDVEPSTDSATTPTVVVPL